MAEGRLRKGWVADVGLGREDNSFFLACSIRAVMRTGLEFTSAFDYSFQGQLSGITSSMGVV